MSIRQTGPASRWLTNFMCVTACLAVLGLIYVASTGTDINIGVSAVVGFFVLNASSYVFYGSRHSTELILEFLKNFKN